VHQPGKRTTLLAGIAGAGITGAAALALAVGPALAEPAPSASPSATGSAAPAPSASGSASAKPDREAARAQRQDELAAALAKELGIDKAKVAAALEKVEAARQSQVKADRVAELKTRLDAAVASGNLTADEAAAILKAAEAGVLPQGGGHGRGGGPGR
jgi:hypothetical protein